MNQEPVFSGKKQIYCNGQEADCQQLDRFGDKSTTPQIISSIL